MGRKPYREKRRLLPIPSPPNHCDFWFGFSEDANLSKRLSMEDTHVFFYDFMGVPNQGFFAIFDGHGGKAAADWCGKHFHEVFASMLRKHEGEKSMAEIFTLTCHEVDFELTDEANGICSGCTFAACLLREEERDGEKVRVLYTANAGDTRAVLQSKRRVLRLTKDHKGSDPEEAQRVRDAGGFIFLERVMGILAITRSLGDEELKQYVIGTPFTSELVLDPAHDIQLVMACDGLWDVLEDHDLHSFVEEEDPTELAQTLVDYALEQGSTDNISVIVVKLFCKKKYHGSGQDSDSPSRHSSDSLNVISLGSSKDQLET